MALIPAGRHYDAMKILTPKIFAGREAASIDFDWEAVGAGVVEFTPIITGEAQEYDWDFGDGSAHSNETNPTHDYEA